MTVTLWFCGLPGSGKSTLARMLERHVAESGGTIELLESDDWAEYYVPLIPMDTTGREIIIRSMALCARQLNGHNIPVIATSTAPLKQNRDALRSIIPSLVFIYCRISDQAARKRDPKGLYALADQGKIQDFPGPGGLFEPPGQANIILDTENLSPIQCLSYLVEKISDQGFISYSPSRAAT